ncbi:hypothetical protein HD806DRAFT_257366 [Xylariaceae sp. AK1471]|nr:hypothetical protein HD806DRAFT_257366 [Xylariaceae sp. AK1471]
MVLPPKKQPEVHPIPTKPSPRAIVPAPFPVTFILPKGADQLALAIVFERVKNGERLVIMIGSDDAFEVAFDACELGAMLDFRLLTFEAMQARFQPITTTTLEQKHHRIHISASPVVQYTSKYYLTDIEIESVNTSQKPLVSANSPVDSHQQKIKPKKSSVWRPFGRRTEG